MKKCLQITLMGSFAKNFLHEFVQHHARACALEGLAQGSGTEKVRIIACGGQDKLDNFLDILHHGSLSWHIDSIQAEPFLPEKDYRGVFRVIE